MASITLTNVVKTYPDGYTAVKGVDLDIADGEFVILVGPSGCGKSTLLRMIVGLEDISDGELKIGDEVVNDKAPRDRNLAMVFQNYALYPHMTVADNMGFALKIAGEPKDEIRRRVEEAAKILDLEPYLDRKPKALSGGQRQRVAMGRAIVREPQVFLMDEPLSNLDAKLRVQTRTQIASLQRRLGITTVYVTHDQTEALTMGDRIAVLKDGLLQQVGTPDDMYKAPANSFVAGFIGSPAMNLGKWKVSGNTASFGEAKLVLPDDVAKQITAEDNGQIMVGFRPEALEWVSAAGASNIPLKVDFVEHLGSDAYVYGRVAGSDEETETFGSGDGASDCTVRIEPHVVPQPGDVINLTPDNGTVHYFSAATGERLNS